MRSVPIPLRDADVASALCPLAPAVDHCHSIRHQDIWLMRHAREFPPSSSTSAQVVESGDHFDAGAAQGGRLDAVASLEALISGIWAPPTVAQSAPLDPALPFQMTGVDLPAPATAPAIGLTATVGGSTGLANVAEFGAFAPPIAPPPNRFDFNVNGHTDMEAPLARRADPADLDDDTAATDADRRYLGAYLR